MARQVGKYGRRSPKNAPALKLSAILSGAVPLHPSMADNFTALKGGWMMLGNDTYGDCVAVTWANTRRLVTAALGVEHYPTMTDVVAVYKTQNPSFPSQDEGMDIQTLLEHLHAQPGPDGSQILAFAKVDHSNADEVKAAIAIFGSVWTGLDVLRANEDEFAAGQPWDYNFNSSTAGGHSVITGGYGNPRSRALGGDEDFITWAEETSFTDNFWSRQVQEAWVVIWPEHLGAKAFIEGVDQTALATAYQALTGRPFPVQPGPAPTPTPEPAPAPDNVDQKLAVAQKIWETHEDNMKTMRSCDRTLEAANREWRAAKGLDSSRLESL